MTPQSTRPKRNDSTERNNSSDSRKFNAGRGDGLTAYLIEARDTAPNGLSEDPVKVASVAWYSWKYELNPNEIWSEMEVLE